MKYAQHRESFCAFDGKIILRTIIAFPDEVYDTASAYINDYSDCCFSFAKNILFEHISMEYNNSFSLGNRFEPYLYCFSIREEIEGDINNYTLAATLSRSGQTISECERNFSFRNNYILFHMCKKHPAR